MARFGLLALSGGVGVGFIRRDPDCCGLAWDSVQ